MVFLSGELRGVADVIEQERAAEPLRRITVAVADRTQTRMWARTLARAGVGPTAAAGQGTAGVTVQAWDDIVDTLTGVLSDEAPLVASPDQVVDAVRRSLHDLPGAAGDWLRLSRDHPASWQRLARAIERGGRLLAEPDGMLGMVDLQQVAMRVERLLAADGFAVLGRVGFRAAVLVGAADEETLERAVGVVVSSAEPGEPTGQVSDLPAIQALADALARRGHLLFAHRVAVAQAASSCRELAVVPDAQAEARLAAATVFRWLTDPDQPAVIDEVAVVVPESTSYATLVASALDQFGIPHWSTRPSGTWGGTAAGRAAGALASVLDRRAGCLSCANEAPGHDCRGAFPHVKEFVTAFDSAAGSLLLDAARRLNLTAGLRHWRTLARWLAGDDDALPAVSERRSRLKQQADAAVAAVRERISRDVISRAEDRDDPRVVESALAVFVDVLTAGESASGRDFAARLRRLADAAKPRIAVDLRALADSIGGVTGAQSSSYRELVRPFLAAGVPGDSSGPGDGVAVLTPAQSVGMPAMAIAWLGLSDGLTPTPHIPDPLVPADLAMVRTEQQRLRRRADLTVAGADRVLLTLPRVRVGSRTTEVASQWLLRWVGLVGAGAHDLVDAESSCGWVLAEPWRATVWLSGLDVVRDNPLPVGEAGASPAAGSEATVRLLERVAALSVDNPGVADGVLGPNPEGASWLAARARPDKPLSPSGVDYYLNCPRQFFWSQIVGVYAQEDPKVGTDLPATKWGTVVHDAIEGCWSRLSGDRTGGRAQTLRDEIIRQSRRQLPFLDLGNPAILDRMDRQAVAFVTFVDGFRDGDVWSAEQPRFEVLLEGEIAGVELRGFADIVWPDRMVDVKTGQNPTKLTISDDGLALLVENRRGLQAADNSAVRKALQVGLYAGMAGAGRDRGGELSGEYWHIKPDKETRIQLALPTGPVTEADWRFHALARVRAGVDSGLFPAVGDPVDEWKDPCRYCDYESLCGGGVAERWAEISSSPVVQPALFQDPAEPADSGGADS